VCVCIDSAITLKIICAPWKKLKARLWKRSQREKLVEDDVKETIKQVRDNVQCKFVTGTSQV